MIDFYTFNFPDGHQVAIMLEELGMPYKSHVVDLTKGENFSPKFEKISPNHTIPAILDHEGPEGKPVRVFEAGAILLYLAQKSGRYLGINPISSLETSQWLMLVLSGLAPFAREFLLEKNQAEPYEKMGFEGRDLSLLDSKIVRHVSALDFRLREYPYLAKSYSIADMSGISWIHALQHCGCISVDDYVGVRNWYSRMNNRQPVRQGLELLEKD